MVALHFEMVAHHEEMVAYYVEMFVYHVKMVAHHMEIDDVSVMRDYTDAEMQLAVLTFSFLPGMSLTAKRNLETAVRLQQVGFEQQNVGLVLHCSENFVLLDQNLVHLNPKMTAALVLEKLGVLLKLN